MAKLPNITEDRQTSGAGVNQGVAPTPMDISPVYEAESKLGQTAVKAGEEIISADNHIQRFNYALNKSRLTRGNAALIQGVEKDINDTGDYTLAEENYNKGLTDLQSSLGQDITHPSYKGKFDEDVAGLKEQTLLKVRDLQERAQQSKSYALADQELDKTVESAIEARNYPELQEKIIKNGLAPVIAAIPNTDPDKAVKIAKIEEQFKKRIGIGTFNSLNPRQQLQALDNYEKDNTAFSTTAYIPPEERPLYRQRAEQALKQDQNKAVTDIRNADFLRKRNAEQRATDIVVNGGTVKDLPIQDYALLDDSTKRNLNQTAEIYNGSKKISNIESKSKTYQYMDMYHNNPEEFAKIDPITITSSVDPKDAKMVLGWQKNAQAGGSMPVDLATQNKIANQTLNSIGIPSTNKKATVYKNRYNEEIEYFKQVHNKEPGLKDLQSIAHSLVVQATFDKGWLDRAQKKSLFEGNVKDIVVPEDFTNRIILQAQKAGRDPLTEDAIKKAYINSLKVQ